MMTKIDSCQDFWAHLDDYLDGELDTQACTEMEKHAAECESCRTEMGWRTSILEMCAGLDAEVSVPEECHAAWKQAIVSAGSARRHKLPSRWTAGIAACLALWLGLTGVLRSGGMLNEKVESRQYAVETTSYDTQEAYEESSSVMMRSAAPAESEYMLSSDGQADNPTTGSMARQEPKVIRSATRSLESTAYDADLTTLTDLVAEYDAYFESRNESGRALSLDGQGRNLHAVIRVPTSSLDSFLASLVAVGTTVQRTDSAEDISERYYDSASRLESQRAQLKRLQEMYASAETVEELLSIEARISEVQYEIDSLESSLAHWDSQISYSTVHVYLSEVAEANRFVTMETTLSDRISKAFKNSINWLVGFFQDALVVLAEIAPMLVVIVPAALLVFFLFRLIRRLVLRRR